MFSKKTARAAVLWLLAIFSLFSFIGCDLSESEVTEPLPRIDGGMLSSLRIAGKSAEFKEPEIYPAASPEVMEDTLEEAQSLPSVTVILVIGVLVIAVAICAYIIIRKRRG